MRGSQPGLAALGIALTLALPALARDPIRPAELPPADYAGQQYVDSKGCMFVRAGTAAEVLWIPRVSRQGEPLCSSPPSGQRVPVAEEVGVAAVPLPDSAKPKKGDDMAAEPVASNPVTNDAAEGGFFVAVGSFGVPENADKAEAKLLSLNYRVVRGRLQGGSSSLITVFAGPFSDATTAANMRQELRAVGFPDATVIGP
jgi:cell division septation protein DedD